MKESLSKDLLFDFFDGRTTSMQRKLVEDCSLQPGWNERFWATSPCWKMVKPEARYHSPKRKVSPPVFIKGCGFGEQLLPVCYWDAASYSGPS